MNKEITIDDYKKHLKERTDALLSENEYEVNTYSDLFNQYKKMANLQSQHKEAEESLHNQKESLHNQKESLYNQKVSALRDNYIAQALAQNKAKQLIAISGTGHAEKTLFDLYREEAQKRNEILSSYDEKINSYDEKINKLANSYETKLESQQDVIDDIIKRHIRTTHPTFDIYNEGPLNEYFRQILGTHK